MTKVDRHYDAQQVIFYTRSTTCISMEKSDKFFATFCIMEKSQLLLKISILKNTFNLYTSFFNFLLPISSGINDC